MAVGETSEAAAETSTQVLEFLLGEERFCVALDAVAEIIDRQSVRSIPGSPPTSSARWTTAA